MDEKKLYRPPYLRQAKCCLTCSCYTFLEDEHMAYCSLYDFKHDYAMSVCDNFKPVMVDHAYERDEGIEEFYQERARELKEDKAKV